MINSLLTYVLNIYIREIFEKDIELSGKITLYDPTHMIICNDKVNYDEIIIQ